ncbi:MAG: methylenetetrahydrofolate reductase [Salinivirgaceae bacterium]|jgi:methylenetetrahydrofolate reductase (NADPH)|nr:methylenetetrahydrofolate reductase [Salinivirgaceae bacterium]
MKVIDKINTRKKTLFSIEIVPPLRGNNIEGIYKRIDPLIEFDPAFINITYHKDEATYIEKPDGSTQKRIISKRPGTVALTASLMNKYKVEVVPHLTCGGFTKDQVESALIDFNFLGIENLLILQGDAGKGQDHFIAENGGHTYAVELLEQVLNMNEGKYLDENLKQHNPSNFCCGVAGYPEKHYAAASLDSDIQYLKAKVLAGADYIVTQMFFDNKKYFAFVDKCRAEGIEVPIIPGLKPIAMLNQVDILPKLFHLEIPEELSKEVHKCKDNKEALEVGTQWGIQQAKELMENGAPVLHFYTLGAGNSIRKIAEEIF